MSRGLTGSWLAKLMKTWCKDQAVEGLVEFMFGDRALGEEDAPEMLGWPAGTEQTIRVRNKAHDEEATAHNKCASPDAEASDMTKLTWPGKYLTAMCKRHAAALALDLNAKKQP